MHLMIHTRELLLQKTLTKRKIQDQERRKIRRNQTKRRKRRDKKQKAKKKRKKKKNLKRKKFQRRRRPNLKDSWLLRKQLEANKLHKRRKTLEYRQLPIFYQWMGHLMEQTIIMAMLQIYLD